MPRPKKKFDDPKQQKAHEERLKKRRMAHAKKRGVELAGEAAEEAGVDFQKLIEEETERQEGRQVAIAKKGGSQSPKVSAKARDDMALAFELMGGVPALVVWGRQNPTEFYRIWARLIPKPAEEAAGNLPLETLLEKLANREQMSVVEAARDIGEEALGRGRREAEIEDAEWEPAGSA